MSTSFQILNGVGTFISGAIDSGSINTLSDTSIVGKWEVDPDDESSIQFRIPSASFGGSNDRIGLYFSGSGQVGIGTKDPETAFDVRDFGEDVDPKDRTAKTKILKISKTTQTFDTPVTASIISASGNSIFNTGDFKGNLNVGGNLDVTGEIECDHLNISDTDDGIHFGDTTTIHVDSSNNLNVGVDGVSVVDLELYGHNHTYKAGNTMTLDAAGDITIDAGGADVILKDDGTEYGKFSLNSNNLTASGHISSSGNFIGNNIGSIYDNYIYLTPTDFDHLKDKVAITVAGEIENNGGYLADNNARGTYYAQKMVPKGYKATHVIVEGSSTSDNFKVHSSSYNVGTTVEVGSSTAVGTEKAITGVIGGSGTYVSIEWASRGNTDVYGGYIKLVKN